MSPITYLVYEGGHSRGDAQHDQRGAEEDEVAVAVLLSDGHRTHMHDFPWRKKAV